MTAAHIACTFVFFGTRRRRLSCINCDLANVAHELVDATKFGTAVVPNSIYQWLPQLFHNRVEGKQEDAQVG